MSDRRTDGADGAQTALVRETARRMRVRPDAVFDLEHPEQVVPLLPVQELLFAIQEMGVTDASDLVALTTPAQVQAFFDLSVWARDRVDPEETDDWLTMLLELEDQAFEEKTRRLDPELLGAVMRKFVEVYDPQLQDVPDLDMAPYATPDTFFTLLPRIPEPDPDTGALDPHWDPQADPRFPLITQLLDKLYRVDPERGRALVMEAASSTTSELEELAYRWRSGRLADLGYEPYAEALQVLQFLDPAQLLAQVSQPDPAAPPPDPEDPVSVGGVLLEPVVAGAGEAFLTACLETLSAEDAERVTQGFTYLANRLAAATLTQPGDVEAMGQVLTRARQALNLGLEYLTRRKAEAATEVFARLAVVSVFRVGHSLTLQLQRLVGALGRSGRLSLATRGFTLLDPPWRRLAEGLSQRFPQLTRDFDEPAAEGFRPVLGLADLLHTTRLVEDLSAQWPLLFLGLKFELDWLTPSGLEDVSPSEPGAVRLGDLFRTAALHHRRGGELRVVPLAPEELQAEEATLADTPPDVNAWSQELADVVGQALKSQSLAPPPRLQRVLKTWLAPLASEPLSSLVLHRNS